MSKYIYPAVFHQEDDGGYSISFPDIENCVTCGDDLSQGLEMAADVLPLMLTEYENDGREIPAPTDIKEISVNQNEFVTLISCDTDKYRRLMNSTAVKKTLSIPMWLNESAVSAGINFSQVLQDALKKELGIA